MSENPSEEDKGASQEMREFSEYVAEYFAMPLRTIVALHHEGKMAILGCGHWKMLRVPLREGDTVRCRYCYEGRMREAREMVERDCV